MELEEILENLGLSDKEAKVYFALLKNGTGSAHSLAEASGLKRPTVYVILDNLISKKVAYLIPKTKKKLYRATPPERLIEIAEMKIEMVKKRLPEIQALARNKAKKPQVLYFEGVGGVNEAINYRVKEMKDKETTGFFARATGDTLERFNNFEEYNDKLRMLGVKARGIVPKSKTVEHFRKTDKDFNRDMIALPESKYSSTVSMEICRDLDWIKICDFENLQALIIENEPIVKTLAEVFELVWECQKNHKHDKIEKHA